MAAVAVIAVDAALAPTDDHGSLNLTFVTAFIAILAIALVAQSLMLKWRPWFPGAESEKSLLRGVRAAVASFMSLL
jgi:light-harvesting complex 1 beta chain